MATTRFDSFFDRAIEFEGKVNEDVPGDAGGPTHWGITIGRLSAVKGVREPKRGTPAFDALKAELFALSVDETKDIYRRDYWDAVRADDLPPGLDHAVADFGLNSGPARAIRMMQRLCATEQTGKMDDQTISEAKAHPAADLINAYCNERARFLNGIVAARPSQGKFLKGWLARVGEVRRAALADAKTAPTPSPAPMPKAVEPPPPSVVAEAAKSKSVRYLAGAALAWLEAKVQFVKGLLPDAQKEATDVVEPLTALGGMLKANLEPLIFAVVLVVIVTVIYRHARDKAELAKARGE